MMALLLALSVFVQDTDKADKWVEKLRGSIEERKEATQELMRLKRRSPEVAAHLKKLLEDEFDPRVKARLEYIIDAVEVLPVWEKKIGARMHRWMAVSDEHIAVQTIDSKVHLLKTKDGKKVWAKKATGNWGGGPLIIGDAIYATVVEKGQYALSKTSLKNGKYKRLAKPVMPWGAMSLGHDGDYVAFARSQREFQVFSTKTLKGVRKIGTVSYGYAYAMKDGRFYCMDAKMQLACTDIKSGKEKWTTEPNAIYRVLGTNGDLVMGISNTGKIRAYDCKDGKIRWSVDLPQEFQYAWTASFTEVVVLLQAHTGQVGCFRLDTGAKVWVSKQSQSTGNAYTPPIVMGNSVVLWGGTKITVMDLKTGGVIAVPDTDGEGIFGVSAVGNRIYVLTQDRVLAFEILR